MTIVKNSLTLVVAESWNCNSFGKKIIKYIKDHGRWGGEEGEEKKRDGERGRDKEVEEEELGEVEEKEEKEKEQVEEKQKRREKEEW